MGRLRWEVAGNEMGRRIYHRRWDIQDGKWQVMRIYHMTWDFQDSVPSFEQDDKQRDDKFHKTERGRQWGQQGREEWGESKVEKCLVRAVCMHR